MFYSIEFLVYNSNCLIINAMELGGLLGGVQIPLYP